jgi:hypothetical protein
MKRREFITNLAGTVASVPLGQAAGAFAEQPHTDQSSLPSSALQGHTLIAEFTLNATAWKVYEDLRTRDGEITFVSADGAERVLRKAAEAAFPEADPPHLGLSMDDIGLSGTDLLASEAAGQWR